MTESTSRELLRSGGGVRSGGPVRRGGRGCRSEAWTRDPRRSVRDLGVQALGGCYGSLSVAGSRGSTRFAASGAPMSVLSTHVCSVACVLSCVSCVRASGSGGIAPPHRCGPGAVQLAVWEAFPARPEQGGSAENGGTLLGTRPGTRLHKRCASLIATCAVFNYKCHS